MQVPLTEDYIDWQDLANAIEAYTKRHGGMPDILRGGFNVLMQIPQTCQEVWDFDTMAIKLPMGLIVLEVEAKAKVPYLTSYTEAKEKADVKAQIEKGNGAWAPPMSGVQVTFTDEAWVDLTHYLEIHQGDIALGINDFGRLRAVYEQVMGRKPDAEAHKAINPQPKGEWT